LTRFKQVNDQKREMQKENAALKARLAELETAKPQPEVSSDEIRAMIAKKNGLLMEGKEAEAAALDEQLLEISEQRAVRKFEAQQAALAKRREAQSFDAAVAELLEQHPVLDPDSADFNEELQAEVEAKARYYVSQGTDAAEALRKAVARFLEPGNPEPAKPATVVDIRRKIELSDKVPPALGSIGKSGVSELPNHKTQDEWEKLTDKDRDRFLRL
jgi:hypothetical protein